MPHKKDLPLRRLAVVMLVLATCQGSPDIVQNDWVLESRPLITAVTIGPTADAYVRDGTSAGANFGFDPTLQVKTQSGTGNNRVTYLRFPVTALTGPVSNARLRLHGQRAATSTVTDVAYGVPSNTWTEGGITHNNRPALGPAQGSAVIGTTAQYHEWDVTAFVEAQRAAGVTEVSLAVAMAADVTFGPDSFSSREATSNRPELVVSFDAPPPIVTIAPEADAYVRDGTNAGVNFGTASALQVKTQSGTGNTRISYLRFPLSGLAGSVTTATLRLYGSRTTTSPVTDGAYAVSTNTWTETGITYNNAPGLGAAQSAVAISTTAGYHEWNVTAFVKSQRAAGQTAVTLAVRMDGEVTFGPDSFNSREAAANPPQLVVAQAIPIATLTPEADAYVRDGTSAGTNFGAASSLQVKTQTTGNNRTAYLRFSLAGITAAGGATLRLYGNRAQTSAVTDSVFAVSSNGWSELGITYNNRPSLGAVQGPGRAITTTAQYHEWDVTSFVQQQIAAQAGAVTLAVAMDSSVTFSPDTFNSREAPSNRPQLVLGGGSGADSDGDRLPDSAETNTGVFVSPSNTGTDPNNTDTDGDGLPDGDEVLGTTAGLNLPGMGTNPLYRDILMEFDWFTDATDCALHSHRPTAAMITRVKQAFAASPVVNPDGRTGVQLIADYGQGGLFTGGNQVADADGIIQGPFFDGEYTSYLQANFASNRQGYFHYTLMGHYYNPVFGSSGFAELNGYRLAVTLGCSFASVDAVANTIMHEVGHNLGLHHGGFEALNNKPNYNSVMNYNYQFSGVDNNCTPPGDNVLDFSRGNRITLDENGLIETAGICGSPGWDWNGNGTISSTPIQEDINFDAELGILIDYDDWANLHYAWQVPGIAAAPNVVSCQTPAPAP
jgi:hypothetical protein